MTIKSGIFNSVGGDRKYNAEFFAQYFASFIGNGVFPNPSNNLQVTSNTNMRTIVKSGSGWINGYYLHNDSDHVLQHDVAHGTLSRIDRVVLRLNYLTRQVEIAIKAGTSANSPVAPSLTRNLEAHELALGDVLIRNGMTSITQQSITDHRLNTSLCGIVHGTVQQIDTTTVFNQYQSWFNQMRTQRMAEFDDWTASEENRFRIWKATEETEFENWIALEQAEFNQWFQSIQNILEGNVAVSLQSQITLANNDTVRNPIRGRTTNNGNQYTITDSRNISAYVDDMLLVITPNVNSTGVVTIRVNNLPYIPVLRASGSAVSNFYANTKVTLRYSSARSTFISQGEGGEYGNARSNDVLEGVTIGTDSGIVEGTIPMIPNVTRFLLAGTSYTIPYGFHDGSSLIGASSLSLQTSASSVAADIRAGKTAWVNGVQITGTIPTKAAQSYTPSTVNQSISAGQYLSGAQTIVGDADLIAANIISGKNIFGVNGSATPVSLGGLRMAKGVYRTTNNGLITVSGLSFRPRLIVVHAPSFASDSGAVYVDSTLFNRIPNTDLNLSIGWYDHYPSTTGVIITNDGFFNLDTRIYSPVNHEWIALG